MTINSQNLKSITINDIFKKDGPLQKVFSTYKPRVQQIQTSNAVMSGMNNREISIIEAPTGVGKSLAYIIPAILESLNGKVTIVTTNTKALQDQLMNKDIPLALSLFPSSVERHVNPILIKGRANYLCLRLVDDVLSSADLLDQNEGSEFIRNFITTSKDGDINPVFADITKLGLDIDDVIAVGERCTKKLCPFMDRCYYYKKRQDAKNSYLIVVNHALFFADLQIRSLSSTIGIAFDTILPEHYNNVVIDEAHNIENNVSSAFSKTVQVGTVSSLIKNIHKERDLTYDTKTATAVGYSASKVFSYLSDVILSDRQEVDFSMVNQRNFDTVKNLSIELVSCIQSLSDSLECKDKERLDQVKANIEKTQLTIVNIFDRSDSMKVRWAQKVNKPFGSYSIATETPIDISEILYYNLWDYTRAKGISATLVSATLSTHGGFGYIKHQLGLNNVKCNELIVSSPFDYKSNSILYVPSHIMEPPQRRHREYIDSVAAEILYIINISKGRAFLLFTSWEMLKAVYEIISIAVDYTILCQGEDSIQNLIHKFNEDGNAILFGVSSFWEGVDIPGESLSCVIIDKIPFTVHNSPVMAAKSALVKQNKRNPFMDLAVPEAIIKLKQGYGRLIRTVDDTGIVVILDTRLLHKSYGALIAKSLPDSTRVSIQSRLPLLAGEILK